MIELNGTWDGSWSAAALMNVVSDRGLQATGSPPGWPHCSRWHPRGTAECLSGSKIAYLLYQTSQVCWSRAGRKKPHAVYQEVEANVNAAEHSEFISFLYLTPMMFHYQNLLNSFCKTLKVVQKMKEKLHLSLFTHHTSVISICENCTNLSFSSQPTKFELLVGFLLISYNIMYWYFFLLTMVLFLEKLDWQYIVWRLYIFVLNIIYIIDLSSEPKRLLYLLFWSRFNALFLFEKKKH